MALCDLRVDPAERVNVAYHKPYERRATFFRDKVGNIVLGDGRSECDWTQGNKYDISNFAPGAHDRKLSIKEEIVPPPNTSFDRITGSTGP
jgi:hypothetical protein